MKPLVWVLVIGSVAVALAVLTDLSRKELSVASGVIGSALVIGYEVMSDRRASRAWAQVRRRR